MESLERALRLFFSSLDFLERNNIREAPSKQIPRKS
nr:MAG TPA: hypothetical protein [Caudoviricetes sp.]